MEQELQALSTNIVQSAEDDEDYFYKRLRRLGLVLTLAYHCNRCNHIWLPRFFDPTFYNDSTQTDPYLMKIATPTACARCKSKYWNIKPTRKTKRTIAKNGNKRDKFREDDKLELFGHDMLTIKRILAFYNKINKRKKDLEKAEQQLNELKKKAGMK